MKLRRSKLVAPPRARTPESAWRYVFETEPPAGFIYMIRAWLFKGLTEEDIIDAIIIAAGKTNVPLEDKGKYVNGVLRTLAGRRAEA